MSMTENEYREKMRELGWEDESIELFIKAHDLKQSHCKSEISFELFLISCPEITSYPGLRENID